MNARDEALIAAWHGKETMVDIGRRLGMTPRSVRAAYKSLALHGLVPSVVRPHIPASVHSSKGNQEKGSITVGKDRLLSRLVEVYGGAA